jgi:sugar/nucleoside kinase (ribokinase family)
VGLVATDFLVRTPFPVPRDTKVRSKGLVRQGGGPAANAAVALARLGVPASFVGAVGDDALGREQRDELERAGVDVANVTPCPGVSSFASFILVDEANGDRTIISAPDDRPVMGPGQSFDVAPFSLVLADGWAGPEQVRCLRDANAHGVPILLDAGSFRPEIDEILGLCDVVIGSSPFAHEFAGGPEAALAALLARGVRFAAITLGAAGAIATVAGSAETFHVPAVPVPRASPPGGLDSALDPVLDTTGAGDAFHAGAACGLLEGRSWDESLRLGAAVASLACGALGARGGLPSRPAALAHGHLDRTPADS